MAEMVAESKVFTNTSLRERTLKLEIFRRFLQWTCALRNTRTVERYFRINTEYHEIAVKQDNF